MIINKNAKGMKHKLTKLENGVTKIALELELGLAIVEFF
jgi:hypothetical protein